MCELFCVMFLCYFFIVDEVEFKVEFYNVVMELIIMLKFDLVIILEKGEKMCLDFGVVFNFFCLNVG